MPPCTLVYILRRYMNTQCISEAMQINIQALYNEGFQYWCIISELPGTVCTIMPKSIQNTEQLCIFILSKKTETNVQFWYTLDTFSHYIQHHVIPEILYAYQQSQHLLGKNRTSKHKTMCEKNRRLSDGMGKYAGFLYCTVLPFFKPSEKVP